MKPILEVIGLNKNYPSFKLDDVNITLPENCITGFIGTNGAGKTTTIKSILGLALKDSGTVKIFDKNMDTCESELKNRIGIVFDEGYFYEDLTISEMKSIIAPAYSHWSNNDFLRNIKRFHLNLKQKISTLSKGMRMKYALTLALSHNADLLIMDEPTSGLDPLFRNELMDILLEFVKADGKSVFFSTHITSDLEKVADMLILIDNGKILFQEDKDVLIENHVLVKGGCKSLNDETKNLFLSFTESAYGFSGLTAMKDKVQKKMKDIVIEKPTIEDIMLAYIGR